jgi:hypothetical protein
VHGVQPNGTRADSWVWRGRPQDHPLSIQRQRKRDRERQLQRQRAVFERLVVLTAKVLDQGEPTRFRHEADCRHGLRVYFLYQGRSWALSDHMAATIVRDALRILNVRRPSWFECQPGFTRTRGSGVLYCANESCGRPIERLSNQAHLAYCSEGCRLEAKNKRHYQEHQPARVSYAQERRDRLRAAAEPRICEWCGKSFLPLDYAGKKPQRFCSLPCRSRFASQWAASWRPHRLPTGPKVEA